jgi:hypothetical protein
MRVACTLVLLTLLLNPTESISCIECSKLVEAFAGYCNIPRVGKFVGVCNSATNTDASSQRQCFYVAGRIRTMAKILNGVDDGCVPVQGLVGEEKFQSRLQLCCSDHVQCDSAGQGFAADLCPWMW